MPKLANFLVGRILSDKDPESARGRATIQERLRAGVSVTPLGIGIPASYRLIYRKAPSAFGHSISMRCPHYLDEAGGRCGIWKNRNSVCATWFCKHVRGAVGKSFWRDLDALLTQLETALAGWCMAELGVESEVLGILLPPKSSEMAQIDEHELDGKVDTEQYARIWRDWRGREREFFQQCGELVGALAWEEVKRIGGSPTRIRAQIVSESYARLLSTKLPERVRVASFNLMSQTEDSVRVLTYSQKDPLDLSKVLVEVLRYFDGRTVKEAIEAIAEQQNIKLDDALVRRLLDFRILVEARASRKSDREDRLPSG